MAPAIFLCIFIPPSIVEPLLLNAKIYEKVKPLLGSGGVALADIQYSLALNMQGQIAGATPLSQLFIYINNGLQFWSSH